MITAAGLAGYTVAAGVLAPPLLRRGWAPRAPRLALWLWAALSLSWIAAAALAILAVTAPAQLAWPTAAPGGPAHSQTAAPAAGLLLAALPLAWSAGRVALGAARARRQQRTHAAFLRANGHYNPALGVVVLGQDTPVAYCLPGRPGRIVVSVGALAALTPAQLQAVIAHEQAHLRGRHTRLLTVLSAWGRAFPFVPLLANAGQQAAVLAEMAADDHAARRHHDPRDLAAALVNLAAARANAAALTAGAPAAIARIERLLTRPHKVSGAAKAARLAAGATALALPIAITCLPLIAAACDALTRP